MPPPRHTHSPSQHVQRLSGSVALWSSWGALSGDAPRVVIEQIRRPTCLSLSNIIYHSYLQRRRGTRLLLLLPPLLPLLLLFTHHLVDVVILVIRDFEVLTSRPPCAVYRGPCRPTWSAPRKSRASSFRDQLSIKSSDAGYAKKMEEPPNCMRGSSPSQARGDFYAGGPRDHRVKDLKKRFPGSSQGRRAIF